MAIKLSICIPTYNRAGYIRETLQSIISQASDDVEIVVSDNASEDNTQQIIEGFQKDFHKITYSRSPVNLGADRNFLKAVSLAQGEYCWLMGSDDKIEEGALQRVLSILKENSNLTGITVNTEGYDLWMKNKVYLWYGEKFTGDVLFNSWEECFKRLYIYFGYLSCSIVKRSRWMDVIAVKNVEKYFNAYVHVFIMGNMIQQNPNWLYLHQKCIGNRTGNDSFLNRGYFRRLEIEVFGNDSILFELCGGRETSLFKYINARVIKMHVKYLVRAAKLFRGERDFTFNALPVCFKTYWSTPCFWYVLAPYFLTPPFMFRSLRFVYQKTLKKWRLRKLLSASN